MHINKDYAIIMREGRRLLHGNIPERQPDELTENPGMVHNAFVLAGCMLLAGLILIAWCNVAQANTIDQERLATAIYNAEGIHSKHPYGILAHYKHTTARQACLNTIRHRLRLWNGSGSFIVFLSRTYCPIGALNDPSGLNKNWVKNVSYFYYKGV